MPTEARITSAKSYIIHYAPLAQTLARQSGIPASVILGIALIESGHGSSPNCRMLKNHFGIEGTNYLPSQGVDYHSRYRSYTSDEASFGHFCTVIKRKSYYEKLKGSKNYKAWLISMNARYYSSAGRIWVNKILKAIEAHRLYRFDKTYPQLAGSPRNNWMPQNREIYETGRATVAMNLRSRNK